MVEIKVFPFNSEDVVKKTDDIVVLSIPDESGMFGSIQAYVAIEKDKVDPAYFGLDRINQHRFDSIQGYVTFFSPVCKIQEMTEAVVGTLTKKIQDIHKENPGINADRYLGIKEELHDQFLKELEGVGFTHVIYGYTYGDDGEIEEVYEQAKKFKEEIIGLN